MYVIVKLIDYQEDIIKIFHNKSDLDLYLHSNNILDTTPSHYYILYNLDSPSDYCGILWTEI